MSLKSFKICCLSAILLLLVVPSAFAQTADELARVEKELAEQKAAAQGLEQKTKATEAEVDDLRKRLISATSEMQAKQAEQEDLTIRFSALEKETALRAAVLAESRHRLQLLTSALLELSRVPPELFLLHEDSPDDHVHRTILLKSLLPRLQEQTNVIAQEIATFEELQNQTESQKHLLKASQQNLEWQRHNLDQLVRTRQGYLQKTAAEKEALAKQLEKLTGEAQDLRQLMERVSNPTWSKTVGKGDPGKAPTLKAGLKRPVAGRIARGYGDKDDFGVANDGVVFAASSGSPVVAPQAGRVVFAGPFKGYGQSVILQHANGFHSFLSGFGRVDADMGQNVDAGEPLGVLPAKGAGKPEIYFEWRKGTDPVDPTTGGLTK